MAEQLLSFSEKVLVLRFSFLNGNSTDRRRKTWNSPSFLLSYYIQCQSNSRSLLWFSKHVITYCSPGTNSDPEVSRSAERGSSFTWYSKRHRVSWGVRAYSISAFISIGLWWRSRFFQILFPHTSWSHRTNISKCSTNKTRAFLSKMEMVPQYPVSYFKKVPPPSHSHVNRSVWKLTNIQLWKIASK